MFTVVLRCKDISIIGLFRGLHVLVHLSGARTCSDAVFAILDQSAEEIQNALLGAVEYMADHKVDHLFVYYAGHAVATDDDPEWTVIEPTSSGAKLYLIPAVMKIVQQLGLKSVTVVLFIDACAFQTDWNDDEDFDLQPDASNLFIPVRSGKFDEGVRDGCLFERALEHCLQHHFQDVHFFVACVQELARQLSFGRLCASGRCNLGAATLEPVLKEWPLTEAQRRERIFERSHFLRFACDLWTEEFLERDDSEVRDAISFIREIADLFEARLAWFLEDPWRELEVITLCTQLEIAPNAFQTLQARAEAAENHREPTPRLETDVIPEEVRRAVANALRGSFPGKINASSGEELPVLEDVRCLLQDLSQWYEKYEGSSVDVTGAGQRRCRYALCVDGLDINCLCEGDLKNIAACINQLCTDFEIRDRVYLAPGSLWLVFCLCQPLAKDQQSKFRDAFCEFLHGSIEGRGGHGWSLTSKPSWKPMHAVPAGIYKLVQKLDTMVGPDSSSGVDSLTQVLWLRASDLRQHIAESTFDSSSGMVEATDAWRIIVFEDTVERRGATWQLGRA